MQVCFRTDASLDIGIGHVMRCLTLADALRERGADCRFICREHPGHRMDLIQLRGYHAHVLPMGKADPRGSNAPLAGHAAWLGCSWHEDAEQTVVAVGDMQLDWLVVDHYALDARWERELRPHSQRIMVIDDLADRPHDADLLLDQNLGRAERDYAGLVPDTCKSLIGPDYALLRPEFAQLREYSLARRLQPQMKHLLVSMGGADADNATGKVLDALQQAELPLGCRITVVMGGKAPWLKCVREQAASSIWPCEVRADVADMAQLMADSDLAIGAAGSTSWERCCLGLPTLLAVLAENQRGIATAISRAKAALVVGVASDLDFRARVVEKLRLLARSSEILEDLSRQAVKLTKGDGANVVARYIHGEQL